MRELRPYQSAVPEAVSGHFRRGPKRALVVAPTGSGKTAIAMEMVRRTLERGKKVLFLADRNILVEQFRREAVYWGLDPGLIRRGSFTDPEKPFQIASKGTFSARVIERSSIPLPPADLLLIDECHRIPATSYLKILDRYAHAYWIGLTATPIRPKGLGLGDYFQVMVEAAKISQLMTEGFLVPSVCFAPTMPDLDQLKLTGGDYNKGELSQRMTRNHLVGQATTWWKKLAKNRPTICYAVDIAHSLWLRDQYLNEGIRAVHVDGKTVEKDLQSAFDGFQSGTIDVLCCADLMTEGVDLPCCGCLQIVRPTRSLRLARQMYGRAMRPHEGKKDFILIDHAGVVFLHGFPEEDLEWSLEPMGRTVQQKREDALKLEKTPRTMVCEACYCIFQGQPCCPSCGHKNKRRGRPLEAQYGTLARVFRDRTKAPKPDPVPVRYDPCSMDREWKSSLAIACHKNGSWGMALSIFKARTMLLPWEVGVEPMPPGNDWKRKTAEDLPDFVKRAKVVG